MARGEAQGCEQQPNARFTCGINCGSACLLSVVPDGRGNVCIRPHVPEGAQANSQGPCRIGLGMLRWQRAPERLKYPLKRVGHRGEGRFERISWNEAVDMLADALRDTIRTYGNESIYVAYGTGVHTVTGNAHKRLLNLLGGYMRRIYDYSTHMVQASVPYLFGDDFSPYVKGFSSSYTEAAEHADMMLLFGDNPVETRRGPLGQRRDFERARQAVRARGGRIVHVDCRRNGSVAAEDEWIPLRPGTDAALVAGIAHALISEGLVDRVFLHRYCVGFDEQTMPASYRGKHASYEDYVMGRATDGQAKTPEWAASVTGIPAARIRLLARQLAAAKAPFISQGWGVQRHANGETATRAISVLPCLLGCIGRPGCNTGQRPTESPVELVPELPQGENPCKVGIPAYEWLNAVAFGPQLTAKNAGVQGAERLSSGIKFLWNYAGNCLTNQHGDINWAHKILADESKCAFIVVQDTVMTDTARYADLVLPDVMQCEHLHLRASGFSAFGHQVLLCPPAFSAPGECRSSYEVMADVAERFGMRDAFTQGRSEEEWVRFLYEQARAEAPHLPSWDALMQTGSYSEREPAERGLAAFVENPASHPLRTPSGKIEIFSARLAALSQEWELPAGQAIEPLPVYEPERDERTALTESAAPISGQDGTAVRFPLQCIGWHDRMRVHSSFGFADDGGMGASRARHRLWMNPQDARPRGIETGDRVIVESAVGAVRIPVRVTDEIACGVVGMPQGAWYRPAAAPEDGDAVADTVDALDCGGCINTLTAYRPTPLAKGNGAANSTRVQVRRVG